MSNCSIEDLNSQEKREFKSRLYQQFARIASAAASPRRLELIDLLCQGVRSVEALAAESQMSVASASQHLQVLYQARLVERRRSGLNVIYRLAELGVEPLNQDWATDPVSGQQGAQES